MEIRVLEKHSPAGRAYTKEQLNIADKYDQFYEDWHESVEQLERAVGSYDNAEVGRLLSRAINDSCTLGQLQHEAAMLGLNNSYSLQCAIITSQRKRSVHSALTVTKGGK